MESTSGFMPNELAVNFQLRDITNPNELPITDKKILLCYPYCKFKELIRMNKTKKNLINVILKSKFLELVLINKRLLMFTLVTR